MSRPGLQRPTGIALWPFVLPCLSWETISGNGDDHLRPLWSLYSSTGRWRGGAQSQLIYRHASGSSAAPTQQLLRPCWLQERVLQYQSVHPRRKASVASDWRVSSGTPRNPSPALRMILSAKSSSASPSSCLIADNCRLAVEGNSITPYRWASRSRRDW